MVYWKKIRYWTFVRIKKILKNIESIDLAKISKENLDASINGIIIGTIMTLNYFWWKYFMKGGCKKILIFDT
jgi:hypothetical protein